MRFSTEDLSAIAALGPMRSAQLSPRPLSADELLRMQATVANTTTIVQLETREDAVMGGRAPDRRRFVGLTAFYPNGQDTDVINVTA